MKKAQTGPSFQHSRSMALLPQPGLNQEQLDKLHDVIVILESVRGEMNSADVECHSCGVSRKKNFRQHTVAHKLEGMLMRIEAILEWERNASGT
ncbi:hypothetical protein [uncultured Mediterranean phage uvDeep-CGR2-AD3-C76]|nr:hypothetical protein [uncultured Mediterranean phage uvDeep-CGR2-AD3-C76]